MRKTALITGITGQDGFYLTDLLLRNGYVVYGAIRNIKSEAAQTLCSSFSDFGSESFVLKSVDLEDMFDVMELIDELAPSEIYHLAGQSRVGKSFEIPEVTYLANVTSTLHLLLAIQGLELTETRFFLAGSGEIFGGSDDPATEESPYHPRSPYARSKLAAQLLVESFREARGLFACTGILFNHESPRRSTDFVTGKIAAGVAQIALGRQQQLTLGNLDISRDWGFAGDYVQAMKRMLAADQPQDYVIATGECRSLRQYLETAFKVVGLDWESHTISDSKLHRPVDSKSLFGAPKKIQTELGWQPETSFESLVEMMVRAQLRTFQN